MKALKNREREDKITLRIAFLFAFAVSLLAFGIPIPKAQAAVVFFDTDDPFVMPGETISISIFSTVETDSIRMDRISDDGFGEASNLYLNPNYDAPLDEGDVVNENGVLIEGISTGIVPTFPAVSGILYSFDYLVPMSSPGHTITIFADCSNGAVNQVLCDIGPGLDPITPDSLSLTVIPEPVTIALFGLGMLFLRKDRRQL